MEKYGGARQAANDNITLRMRIACWLTKAKDTHSKCGILNCFSTATMVVRNCVSIALYVHCLSCLKVSSNVQAIEWGQLGCPNRRQRTTNMRCVISRKNKGIKLCFSSSFNVGGRGNKFAKCTGSNIMLLTTAV